MEVTERSIARTCFPKPSAPAEEQGKHTTCQIQHPLTHSSYTLLEHTPRTHSSNTLLEAITGLLVPNEPFGPQ